MVAHLGLLKPMTPCARFEQTPIRLTASDQAKMVLLYPQLAAAFASGFAFRQSTATEITMSHRTKVVS